MHVGLSGLVPATLSIEKAMNGSPLLVTAAILRRRGRILIARRAPGRHMAGCWEFPGGKIESGESPQACLARELQEELGIQVHVGRFVMATEHAYADRLVRLLAYEVRHLRGRFRLSSHDAMCFCPARDLLSLVLAPADIPIAIALGAQSVTANGTRAQADLTAFDSCATTASM